MKAYHIPPFLTSPRAGFPRPFPLVKAVGLDYNNIGVRRMNIKKRFGPAVLIVAVTLGCTLLGRFTRVLFFLALAVASAFEVQQVLEKANMPVSMALPVAYIAAHAALCWFRAPNAWMEALFILAAVAAMCWTVLQPRRGAMFAVSHLFLLVWPFAFYAVILRAAASDAWLMTIFLGVLSSWACDCMALVGGKYLGVHKLAPTVSPHKTWEGAIVGGLSSILAGMLMSWILGWQFGLCVVTAFVASTFGQFGDLAASLFKRMAGVKDYGHLMPEHGGIMDKMDSVLFAVPAAYFVLCLYGVA